MLAVFVLTLLVNIFNFGASELVTFKVNIDRETKRSLGYVEDAYLNFTELANKYGYPSEEHSVITEDGYILKLFRIPHGRHSKNKLIGIPVLAVHGLAESADAWIFPGPEHAIGYQLADAGYDLWCTNFRGNTYSRNHTILDPDKDVKFWKFCADEIAAFDIPAAIEYILKVSGKPSLNYVGISLGTNVFYKMGAYKPDLYDNVNIMVSLAPIAWLTHLYNPFFRFLSLYSPQLEVLGNEIGIQELFYDSSVIFQGIELLCKNVKLTFSVCASLIFSISGDDFAQLREEFVPIFFGHYPGGISLKTVAQLGQSITSKKMLHYDYGTAGNLKAYGTTYAPKYNLSVVTTPVALFSGNNDWLSSKKDVEKLKKHLPNVVYDYVVPWKKWCHFDFLYGKDAAKVIGTRILRLFTKYSKK